MIVNNLQLDDEIALDYQNEAVERGFDDLRPVLADRLRRAIDLDPRHPYLILSDMTLKRIEQALGGLPFQNTDQLVRATERLARIKFGEHELELTPGQLEEIAWTAAKQGKSVDAILKETWGVFCRDFFTLVPHKR